MELIKDKASKIEFIGVSLGGLSTTESAVAVLDSNLHIIMLDKLFSMSDVKYFLDNQAEKKKCCYLSIHSWKWNYVEQQMEI